MANSLLTESGIAVAEPTSPTKTLDSSQVTTSKGVVDREAMFVADPIDPNARAAVLATDPHTLDYGEVVRVVTDRPARRADELQAMISQDAWAISQARRSYERCSFLDRRGSVGRGSTR